jgi:carbamoyltransferase
MTEILNSRIKHRETFRPFAPSILEHETGNWFEKDHPSPFMLMTYDVRSDKRKMIPAPTHIDGTGRLQTVSRSANPSFFALIEAFQEKTGVPVLLNTSFNDNEPVVDTPLQAIDCALRTGMDVLVLGAHLVDLRD